MDIGTKIRNLRITNKLTQPELAHKLNISQTALSEIESGKTKKIDFLFMDKVCKEFEVDFEYFRNEDKKTYNIKKNKSVVVSDNTTINNVPEGILENMLKRLELLENKLK